MTKTPRYRVRYLTESGVITPIVIEKMIEKNKQAKGK